MYDNYGLNYRNNFIFDSAEYYYSKSLELRKKNSDSLGIINVINNLACIEGDYASLNLDRFQLEKASKHHNRAIHLLDSSLKINQNIDLDLLFESNYLKYIIYNQMLYHDSSFVYLQKFAKYQKQKYGKIELLVKVRLAICYMRRGQLNKASPLVTDVENSINKETGLNKLNDIYDGLKVYYEEIADYEKSLNYFNLSLELKDKDYDHAIESSSGKNVMDAQSLMFYKITVA